MTKQKLPRVVMVLSSFPKISETFIVNKFVGLLEKSWDIHIVCAESSTQEWQNFPVLHLHLQAGKRVHTVWRHRPRWLAALLTPLAFLRCLLAAPRITYTYIQRGWMKFGFDILRRLYLDAEIILSQPDIIHFEFGALAPERMYLKDLLQCKILVSFRGYDLNFAGLENPNYYQTVWEQADALHLLSEDLWQRAIKRGCPLNKPHTLISPALNAEGFTPLLKQPSENSTRLKILSVGRLEWKKGYEYALQSIRLLNDMGIDCQFTIIGAGQYLEMLTFARHQLNLSNNVEFLGALPHSQVLEYMRTADLFLHAAVSEGFCNAVLEAQAMTIPVVCTDADGLRENVKDGETGFVVPRRNPQALAEKMALLAYDPQLRKKMGEAGRKHVLEHFQIEDQIEGFEKIYSQLLDSS